MTPQLLQVNFRINFPVEDYEKMTASAAEYFTGVPGLQWKIWLLNKEQQEAGGIYLFDSKENLMAYLQGDLFKKLETKPGITQLQVKQFDLLAEPGLVTQAPVLLPAGN